MELKNSYGQFAELHLCDSGIVRTFSAAIRDRLSH
jgi:hypothetical protein